METVASDAEGGVTASVAGSVVLPLSSLINGLFLHLENKKERSDLC